MSEQRDYKSRPGRSEMGKSTTIVKCPFCDIETECYTWSLFGSGKRCVCGAIHHGMGYSIKK